MKFKIMVVHQQAPTRTPQLFATVCLPDKIHVGYKHWIESNNEETPEEIVRALNESEIFDCIFSVAQKTNHQKAMQKYWKRRNEDVEKVDKIIKTEIQKYKDRTSCAKSPAQNTMEICHTCT